MSSGCDHAVEYIYQYLDEEISFLKKTRIRMHLRHCSHCTDAFQFEAKLKDVIRERGATEPPPELFDTLRALIEEEREKDESGM